MKQYVTNFKNLTINKSDKSDKSSNTLQVGQIKHCKSVSLGPVLPMYFFLLSMRFCLEKQKTKKKTIRTAKQGQDILKTPSEWRSFSRCLAIFFQVPRDPLPAVRWDERVSLGALKRSDREGNSGEVRRSTEEEKRRVLFQ